MDAKIVFAGADETTPSRAQFFSWINNTNEGTTEAQTLVNLAFFRWLHDEYGMTLDIYAFDAGAIDGACFYGTTDSERFRRQFPRGFAPLVGTAAAMGTRLGVWGGPDGFGDTPAEAQARIDMMVSLCRNHHFALFKMDAVCGQLRKDKQPAFVEMMTQCRKYSPDLILLNHRLDLGEGLAHATTFLWEGAETYIDVHMANSVPATHNRLCSISRGLTPDLKRLTEDHGVCLSSCLDYWEDDLILQAFNRCLILAPEIYGNPWFLRDDEYPRLARIYNLHRRFRDILTSGMVLPEAQFGPHAVSRGNGQTRLITLRNLGWEAVRYRIRLDATIGLSLPSSGASIELRRLHPQEQILSRSSFGDTVDVEVLPFRSCLLLASSAVVDELAVEACQYEVVRDVAGKPAILRLLGEPGTTVQVKLASDRSFGGATLDGKDASALAQGKSLRVSFPGEELRDPWHRKLGELSASAVPVDAEALYEATCFAADNNALEVRELLRSGPTKIPQVQAARDAFFNQPIFRHRNLWDRNLFDDDPETGFAVTRRRAWSNLRVRGGCFRLDLGEPTLIDHLVYEVGSDHDLQPLRSQECTWGSTSADLKTWQRQQFWCPSHIEAHFTGGRPIRYIRLNTPPDRVRHIRGFYRGKALDRTRWRASNLLANYASAPAKKAWTLDFTLPQTAPNSYLAIAIHGIHGQEGAYAALRAGDAYVGAPRRAPSFLSDFWECPVRQVDRGYAYFIPVTPDLVKSPLQAVVLGLDPAHLDLRPELWITAHPVPLVSRELILNPL